ncbi:MAG: TonB-dependent receptor [Gemmatimonadetes bacterium]|nr:TonB-dependent receptor [Gemmatimonadota bacterium]MCY3678105.1 TonB-dependent receptor [Gemmatimonadota bacterium]
MTSALLIVVLQQATLAGVVRDSIDLEPVAFAQVSVVAGDAAGAGSSDRFGAFVMPNIPSGQSFRLEVTAFGYEPWVRSYDRLPVEPVRVLLHPSPIALEGIEVLTQGRAGDPISLSRDAFVVDSALMRTLPTILETDVLRATAVSPSASAPSDYAAIPYVRGGTSEGTPVLLDGVRLFNAFHLGGFLSAVNAEVVERATLLPGYGADVLEVGSLSGAIDIATRDGARDGRHMAGSVGLASSRLSLEGPVGEGLSYLVDGRRTYIDGFTRLLEEGGFIEQHVPYFFQDLHAKVTKDWGGLRRLSVSAYANSEALGHFDSQRTRTLDLQWGNAAFSIHYRDKVGAKGLLDATVGRSRFSSNLLGLGGGQASYLNGVLLEYEAPIDTLLSGIGSMSEDRADLRLTWHAGRATVVAGAQATRFSAAHRYDLDDEFEADDGYFFSPLDLRQRRWRFAGHSSVDMELGGRLSSRAGLRVDRFAGLATTVSPFAELSYTGSWWDARLSASQSRQTLASVRNEEALGASFLAYDLLVPVSSGPVPRNTQFSVGWEGAGRGLRIRVDAYARTLANLRLPALGEMPVTAAALGDPSLWEVASGTARGIEASWSWQGGRGLAALGSYRWARVSRTVGDRTYTPRFHREHEFEFATSYTRGTSSWSARFSLRSGQPTTPLEAIVPVERHPFGTVQFVPLGGRYNSGTLPHYARVDVGWRRPKQVSWFGGGSVVPYLSVANLFSLPNVVGLQVKSEGADGAVKRVYLPQLPMIPFVGVEFRF